MSSIETVIYTRLSNWPALATLVSDRIFPGRAAQGTKRPFVVFMRVAGPRAKHSLGPAGVAMPRFQFDCYSVTYEQAVAIATQVRLAIDGWKDLSASPAVKSGSLITDRDIDESATDPKLYRASMDFMITHNEATT